MHLTKQQSAVIAFAALALFFGLGAMLLKQSRTASQAASTKAAESVKAALAAQSPGVAPSADSEAPDSKFTLNEFHRSETKNGVKLWEITAKRGLYSPEKTSADLFDAELQVYRKTGEVVTLLAKRAKLFFDNYDLKNAVLSEGLTLFLGDKVKLETSDAVFEKSSNQVRAPGKVKITSDLIEITGEELNADITTQEVTIARNVESEIKPKAAQTRKGRK